MKAWMFEKSNAALGVTLLLAFLSSCAPESKNLSSYQNSIATSKSANIIGGVNATSDYQKQNGIVELSIQIQDPSGQQGTATCTGTLIAKRLILTAAHCLADSGITNIAAVFATDENTAQRTDVVFAVDGVIHPDFLKGIDPKAPAASATWNDIALVKLEADAPADFKFARLPTSQTEVNLMSGSKVSLAGFGITSAIVRKIVRSKKGSQKIVDVPTTGAGVLRKIDNILVKQMSVDKKEIMLDQSKSIGACHGDSGGPAFVLAKDGTSIQVGVTSRGTEKLGNCNENAIYTSVASHLAWIASAGGKLLAKTNMAVAPTKPALPVAVK